MEDKDIIITRENLDEMLEKFFAGDTNRAEEKALESYFCSETDMPTQYEAYRDMFGWYASGMNEKDLPAPSKAAHRRPWRPFLWWGSVAAVITVILCFGPLHDTIGLTSTSAYDGSFVVRDGKMTTGDAEIRAEIEAAILEGQCLEREIDMRISMLNSESADTFADTAYE